MKDAAAPGLAEQVQVEAVRRMHAVLAGAVPVMPLLPAITAWALWPRYGGWQLGAWLLAAVLTPGLRYLLVRRYRPASATLERARRWADEVSVSALLDGVVWGMASLLFLAGDSAALQMLLLTMIVGISAGSVFVTSFWPKSEFAFSVPSSGLAAVALALQGTDGGLAMAAGLLLYLVLLARIMKEAHRTALETIRLHLENGVLVEQLHAQKEVAEHANVAKSRFLAAASHDLRQPLHALGLFTTALRLRVDPAHGGPLLDRIDGSVCALEGLLDALLDVSRLEAGVVEPRRQAVRLQQLLHRLSAEYGPRAVGQGLAWRCEGPDLWVDTDPALLETLVRNLLSNALRYTPQGEVAVTWRGDAGAVLLAVRDTGIGIPAEQQEEVFREFVQLHNPERDRSKGLGLGLTIVDRLTRLLGHRIELDSVPGRGSIFTLRMPATQAPPEQAPAAPADLLAGFEDGLQVLVIEDESEQREAMALLLHGWGCHVTVAASADEALSRLHDAPDAILSDYRLRDGATGTQAIASVRRIWGAAIPALVVTGDTSVEKLRDLRATGHPVLHKPAAPARLRAFLRFAARVREADAEEGEDATPAAIPAAVLPAPPAPGC